MLTTMFVTLVKVCWNKLLYEDLFATLELNNCKIFFRVHVVYCIKVSLGHPFFVL